MTSVTDIYGFKDESTSEISRDVFFPLGTISRKNLPGVIAFRNLKCPVPSMIPLQAEVKECQQKLI